jgi:hypothetical protein
LALTAGPLSTTLLSTAGHPLWLRITEGPAAGLQVWSCPGSLDPEHRIREEKEIEGQFDAVLPLLAFLRGVHGTACWHNPHRHLGLIIDDPLIVARYGCLDFPSLLSSAERGGLHVTLAFIPWNAPRTRPAAAAPFREQADVFSLCLHGCDHTAGEYENSDEAQLHTLNREALRRMATHAEHTGLATQPVMVCPQERFSRAAFATLGAEPGIEAMVNSRFLPRDYQAGALTAADLLQPAFVAYHGCTLLKRFYPEERWKIALGQFLGQPSLLVEHHEYFRRGTKPLEAEVARLRAATPELTSPPITTVVRQTHWRRDAGHGRLEIRAFTRRLDFDLAGPDPTHVTVHRHLDSSFALHGFRLDGRDVAFARTGSEITLNLPALPAGTHCLELVPAPQAPARPYAPSRSQRISIAVRRVLSELRDHARARLPARR